MATFTINYLLDKILLKRELLFSFQVCKHKRFFAVKNEIVQKRFSKKEAKRNEVASYLDSHVSHSFSSKVTTRLLTKNIYPPEALYLVNPKVAGAIFKMIESDIKSDLNLPTLEINPGFGFLSEKLLNAGVHHLRLCEPSPSFQPQLESLMDSYPHGQVSMSCEDVMNIAKTIQHDKITNGNRVENLMSGIQPKPATDHYPVMRIIGAIPQKKFIRNMIFSHAFQNGFHSYGHPVYYLIVHHHNLLQILSKPRDGTSMYRYSSALFQVMFRMTVLGTVPRKDFLPWESYKKLINFSKISNLNLDDLYLIKVEDNPELYSELSVENFPLLWYFYRANLIGLRKKVIASIEQWIPNSGPRLLRHGLSIFTEYGDLSPEQMLQLFKLFLNWPEFADSPFKASMETVLLRNLPADMLEEQDGEDHETRDDDKK